MYNCLKIIGNKKNSQIYKLSQILIDFHYFIFIYQFWIIFNYEISTKHTKYFFNRCNLFYEKLKKIEWNYEN